MAKTKLTIHIRPGATPTSIAKLITLIGSEDLGGFQTTQDLLDFAVKNGLGSYAELKITPQDMGLLDANKFGKCITLSKQGITFSRLRPEIQPEIAHFLMYTGWNHTKPQDFLPSWAYRHCCNQYWQLDNIVLVPEFLDRQVQDIINFARSELFYHDVNEIEEISFSRKSLDGVKKWLTALSPSPLNGNHFSRRTYCAPELLLLAIGFVLQDEADIINTDLLLTQRVRDQICQVCLLAPTALDQLLDWMIPAFSSVVSTGTTAGFYGRFIRLHRLPTLEDIVR